MLDRRFHSRLLCADVVVLEWRTESGRMQSLVANLEDISKRGAGLQIERAVPVDSTVRICFGKGFLEGTVRYCAFREIGYYVGVQFAEGQSWTKHRFKPHHLFDPRILSPKRRAGRKATPAA